MNYYKAAEKKLYSYIENKTDIELLKSKLEQIELDISLTSSAMSLAPSRTFKNDSSIERDVIKKEIEEERIKREIRLKELEVKRVDIYLESLKELERDVIELRYLKMKSWIAISLELNYSRSHLRKIRNKAINQFAETLELLMII